MESCINTNLIENLSKEMFKIETKLDNYIKKENANSNEIYSFIKDLEHLKNEMKELTNDVRESIKSEKELKDEFYKIKIEVSEMREHFKNIDGNMSEIKVLLKEEILDTRNNKKYFGDKITELEKKNIKGNLINNIIVFASSLFTTLLISGMVKYFFFT